MKEITVRLDDDTFLKLWATARRHGLSVEEIARRAISYALNEVYDPNADPSNDPTVRKLLTMLLPVLEGER
jgi:plasmid stability protein